MVAQPPQVARPKARPEPYRLVTLVSTFRAVTYTLAVAVIVSTILMWQTSPAFIPPVVRANLVLAHSTAESNQQPTAIPTPFWMNKIGIVAGHSGIATYGPTKGNKDPGAVCTDMPDGHQLTEADVTLSVAQQVVATLRGRGFDVDLLEEFDPRIDHYQAQVFLSIHADSCAIYNDGFPHSGFAAVHTVERPAIADKEDAFVQCLNTNYAAVTSLPYFGGQITPNMTHYHSLSQGPLPHVADTTPGAIIELGLLYYDRDKLQNHSDLLATGIVNGILCYVRPGGATPANTPQTSSTQSFVPSPTP
jgi:N-acetylmuramoyl-L-alanine amidase